MAEEFDSIEDMEARETARKLPIGWVVLYCALIVWGMFYLYAYTPQLGGWSQSQAYEDSLDR